MSLLVSKNAIVQYLMLYVLLSFQGSVIYKLFDQWFMVFALLCTGLFVLQKRIKINIKYTMWMLVICGLLVINHFTTNGSTSLGTVGNFFSRFCIAFICIELNREKFKERLLNIIVLIAKINLVEFLIGLTPARIVFNFLPALKSSGLVYHCSLFYAARVSDMSRNNGMFGEPGVYQIILNVALVILLFENCSWLSQRKRKNYLIVLILTILTAQSTTGYLGAMIVLGCFVFSSSEYKEKTWLKLLIVAGVALFAVVAIYGGTDSFIYERFTSKLFGGSSGVDLSSSTGRYREISIETDLLIAAKNFWGVGTSQYKVWWAQYVHDWTNTNGSVVGLTSSMATYGMVCAVSMVVFLINGVWKNRSSKLHFGAMIGCILVTVLSQPHILYAIYIALCYPNCTSSNLDDEIEYGE